MQVGDLVRWKQERHHRHGDLGVVTTINNQAHGSAVEVFLIRSNTKCLIQWQHLEVICK